jgi:hypothetical protein
VEEALESAHRELTVVDESTRQQLTPLVEGHWQGRLKALLKEHPETADDLTLLVHRLLVLVPQAADSGRVANVSSGTVGGHLIQARDIHDGVQLGAVQTPQRPGQP